MKQKDIRTRIAELEAEAKAPDSEGVGPEEEEEKSPNKLVMLITGLIMAGIGLYMAFVLLEQLGEMG